MDLKAAVLLLRLSPLPLLLDTHFGAQLGVALPRLLERLMAGRRAGQAQVLTLGGELALHRAGVHHLPAQVPAIDAQLLDARRLVAQQVRVQAAALLDGAEAGGGDGDGQGLVQRFATDRLHADVGVPFSPGFAFVFALGDFVAGLGVGSAVEAVVGFFKGVSWAIGVWRASSGLCFTEDIG
jgi:hypothetical protein